MDKLELRWAKGCKHNRLVKVRIKHEKISHCKVEPITWALSRVLFSANVSLKPGIA
jgi:hypothetical protein